MKKLLLAAVLFTLACTPAMAEEAAPAGDMAGKMEKHMEGRPPHVEINADNFAEHKAKMLKKMDERMAKAQERKACVTAAATPEALKACFPDKGKGGGKMREKMKERMGGNGGGEAPGAKDEAPAEGAAHGSEGGGAHGGE